MQGVVNRDIKLENTLLDGSKRPLLKICDFGYSKNDKDSVPKSKVGTPGYTGTRCNPVHAACFCFLAHQAAALSHSCQHSVCTQTALKSSNPTLHCAPGLHTGSHAEQ